MKKDIDLDRMKLEYKEWIANDMGNVDDFQEFFGLTNKEMNFILKIK